MYPGLESNNSNRIARRRVDGYASPKNLSQPSPIHLQQRTCTPGLRLNPAKRPAIRTRSQREPLMLEFRARRRLRIAGQDGWNISHALKDSDDLQRTGLRIVDHNVVRVATHRPESKWATRQIFAKVPPEWALREEGACLINGRLHPVRGSYAVPSNVGPDFNEIICRLRSEAVEAHP